MTETPDLRSELAAIRAAIEAQGRLKGILPEDQLAQLLAPLQEKEAALLAQLQGSGAIALGTGSVAGGAGSWVAGRDLHVHQSVPTDRTDPAALRRAYLARLMEQVGVLSLAGIDPAAASNEAEARLSLDAVYTALLTLSAGEEEKDLRRAMKAAGVRRLSALEQLNKHRRLVLLGDPGGGKSTFVHFVALCLAGEILEHPQIQLALLRSPLPQDSPRDPEEKAEPQNWDHGPLLPVRVVLRDFAARGLPPREEPVTALHLQAFLEQELKGACLGDFAPLLFKELQEKGGLLLFDGLDEVPEAESRRDRLRQAVESFVRSFGKCRVLLTSRTYAYRSQGWRLDGFAEAELAPFDEAQIESFVHRWYDHAAATGRLHSGDARGRAQLLLQAVLGNTRLRELAERPLLLTLMASLHSWRGGTLPEKREQLYADAVELLLNLWESQRVIRNEKSEPVLMQPSLAQYLAVGRDQVRQVLEELAFEVHARGDLAGTADVPEEALVGRLMKLRRNPETNPAELVDYLSQRAGLLVPRGVGVYTFPHRTFQEYLAACHLTVRGFPRELADLGRRDPSRWREVVLLAGAKAARGAPFAAWSLAERLCPRGPSEGGGAEDAWGAHLAGQVIAESADLEIVDEADLPKLEWLRNWHLHLLRSDLLPARERALAGKTLARLGDPRPEVMTLDGMELCLVPAGPFRMGEGTEERDVDLSYAYQMSRYPVTVAQFREYVRESGQELEEADSLRGQANAPVVRVSWHEALAFCEWLTLRWRVTGRITEDQVVMLPSEEEWEKAARGEDGRVYPWEGEADPEKANYLRTGIPEPSAVGCFPRGESPFRCEEMSGNVWEWTRSRVEGSQEDLRVLRGGDFSDVTWLVRCSVRSWDNPRYRYGVVGFRVVLVPLPSDL